MEVPKSSLVSMLLEEGEEDLAVLLARSGLPEDLDTGRDSAALAEIGLPAEELSEMLPALQVERIRPDADSERRQRVMDSTVSGRWAELVWQWSASGVRAG